MLSLTTDSGDKYPVEPITEDLVYLKPLPYIQAKPSCSCVGFIQSFGFDIAGHAYQLQPNSDEPMVGGLALTKEGPYGHVAVIHQIDFDSLIIVESNYIKCSITYRRISLDSPLIRGFIK